MDYKLASVNFSDNQKAKLKLAFKKKMGVTIQFLPDQLNNGKDKILVTSRQFNKLERHKKEDKGVRIEFSYNQLKENHKGGLLNELLQFVENNVPYAKKLTPYIIKKGAPATKDYLIPWLTNWLNNELDKVIKEGSGIDLKTSSFVSDHLIREAKKI